MRATIAAVIILAGCVTLAACAAVDERELGDGGRRGEDGAAADVGRDVGRDAGRDLGQPVDAAADSGGTDAGGPDAGVAFDAGVDAGRPWYPTCAPVTPASYGPRGYLGVDRVWVNTYALGYACAECWRQTSPRWTAIVGCIATLPRFASNGAIVGEYAALCTATADECAY
jgi:hypothetical protein